MKRKILAVAVSISICSSAFAAPASPTGLRFRGPASVVLQVSPLSPVVITGGQAQFIAQTQNASNPGVTWSVVEAVGCGSVTSAGLYTAPGSAATCRVMAVSQQDPSVTATATISVRTAVAGGPSGAVGVWENIGANLLGKVAGDTIQSVISDPVNPGTFFLATGENDGRKIKWYRTTNFGDSWTMLNGAAMAGNPWGFSIDPNPSRNPATPPTLYSPAGYGSFGAWKSVDGAATWTRLTGADPVFAPYNPYGLTDLYHLQVLPDDPPNHVLATYHYGMGSYDGVNPCKDTNGFNTGCADGGFGETWDGGATWVVHKPVPGIGTSHYVIPISATTWCVISQSSDVSPGFNGLWRTTTAGRVGGTAAQKYRDGTISTAAWTKVAPLEHAHGSFGYWRSPSGIWYIAAFQNIAKSDDQGATWQVLAGPGYWPGTFAGVQSTNLVGTGSSLYSNYFQNPGNARASLADDTNWTFNYFSPAPQSGGAPFGTAVAYASTIGKYVILMGNYGGELWRYIEP